MRDGGGATRGTADVRSRSFLPERGSTIAVTDIRCARPAAHVRRNVSCVKRWPGRDTARRAPQRQREPFRFSNVAEDPPACRIVTTCSKPRRGPVSSRSSTRPAHRRPWCRTRTPIRFPVLSTTTCTMLCGPFAPPGWSLNRFVTDPTGAASPSVRATVRAAQNTLRATVACFSAMANTSPLLRRRTGHDLALTVTACPLESVDALVATATGGGPKAITDRPADKLGTRARVHDRPRQRR